MVLKAHAASPYEQLCGHRIPYASLRASGSPDTGLCQLRVVLLLDVEATHKSITASIIKSSGTFLLVQVKQPTGIGSR